MGRLRKSLDYLLRRGREFSRKHVMDAPMLARARVASPEALLELGCGKGRFCRKRALHIDRVVGIDPTAAEAVWKRI